MGACRRWLEAEGSHLKLSAEAVAVHREHAISEHHVVNGVDPKVQHVISREAGLPESSWARRGIIPVTVYAPHIVAAAGVRAL